MLRRLVRRIAYVTQKAPQVFPLFSENGIGLVLKVMISEALVRRRTYTAKVHGVDLSFRSFTSDIQVLNSWQRQDLADQYDTVDGLDGVIIDAGGHIGMAAVAFARRFPDRRIVTLEPSAENFALLRENTKSLGNVVPMHCALGPEDGSVELIDRTGNTDGFTVGGADGTGPDTGGSQTVRVISIPTLMAEIGAERIALLKLDIEGYEVELLADKPDWMDQVGLVAIELHERFRPGSTRTYINATETGRTDLGFSGEMYFSRAG